VASAGRADTQGGGTGGGGWRRQGFVPVASLCYQAGNGSKI